MTETTQRLERAASILALIDKRRMVTGDRYLGSNIERKIVERELRELEQEILADPGALESQLVRVEHRRRS